MTDTRMDNRIETDANLKMIIYLLGVQGMRWEIETDPQVIMKEIREECVLDPYFAPLHALDFMRTLNSFLDILETNITSEPMSWNKIKFDENTLRYIFQDKFRKRYPTSIIPIFNFKIKSPRPGCLCICIEKPCEYLEHYVSLATSKNKEILGYKLESLRDFFGKPRKGKKTIIIDEICSTEKYIYRLKCMQEDEEYQDYCLRQQVKQIIDSSLFYDKEK